jgi:hypothetical protein
MAEGFSALTTKHTSHAAQRPPHTSPKTNCARADRQRCAAVTRLELERRADLTPTLFEHINPLGTHTFDTDRPTGQHHPLRAPQVA